MEREFLEKLNNHSYISKRLYELLKEKNSIVIPKNFNLELYNQDILEKMYFKYKNYFETMYEGIDANIKLDEDQIKAILAEEDYTLIIAGAGTGKTTTIVSKVKYLVDIKKVDPQKIIVISYTKKATEELEKRIVIDFKIPARVTTFHSLGLKYIREIFKSHKCYVVDQNTRNQIFLDYFKTKIFPNKEKVKEILNLFNKDQIAKTWVFGSFFTENYDKYETFDEYFQAYKLFKKSEVKDFGTYVKDYLENISNQEVIYTLKGELVKSKGEALIANFLFCNNIEYEYEKIYEKLMPDKRTYKPDFTLDLGGMKIYIEYFGLSNYQEDTYYRYKKIKKMKEDYHAKNHTKFIKIDYMPNENILETLKSELIKMGFKLKPKSYEEIFEQILDNNYIAQIYPFKDFLYSQIDIVKTSKKRNNYKQEITNYFLKLNKEKFHTAKRQFFYINDFYHYYQKKLFGGIDYGFDYSDMIYYANKYIDIVNKRYLNCDYLIIDEYQDISKERYEFAKNIALKSYAKVIAVGDDWQAIYAFSGSSIRYIYNFPHYFQGAKLLKINQAYRNSHDLVDYSSTFIMKNKNQIKKELVSNKEIKNPIRFVLFEDFNEYQTLKELILNIHKKNPEHNIMILARTNSMINDFCKGIDIKDEIGTKIKYIGYEEIAIDGMTIHKSKGLTSDEVILIGLDKSFPSQERHSFWFEMLFRQVQPEEGISYPEERRLFYVALTRTRNYVYLLVNKNPTKRSPFINEILEIIKDKSN